VLYGFMDGSNSHEGARIFSLCGFLGDEYAFGELDGKWRKVLGDPSWPTRLARFHAVECVHGYGQFENWRFADRLTLWGRLIDLITSVPLAALGCAIITEDFGRLTGEEMDLLRSVGLGDALGMSVHYVLQKSASLTRNTSEEERIAIAFDNESPERAQKCHRLCDIYTKTFDYGKWLSGIGFCSSLEFTPLQAADLMAYGTYQFVMRRCPDFRVPDFPINEGFERMLKGLRGGGAEFGLDAMRELAHEIQVKRKGRMEEERNR
jgi:hypothetical protein